MKNVALVLLLAILTFGVALEPSYVFAKSGNSGSGSSHMDDDHDDDEDDDEEDEDEDEDNERDDDSSDDSNDDDDDSASSTLEIEADVFTDTTIVKVELENGRKTLFSTEADTRDEVVDVIVARFDLTESKVEAVLDFEIEDRASRAQDRKGINGLIHRHVKIDRDRQCDSASSTLEIEADVFTDTTIVKVEKNGVKTVFKTSATTSAAVVDVVADRFDLTESEIEAVLDFEIEDRASRARDSFVSGGSQECDDSDDDASDDDSDDSDDDSTDEDDRDAKIAKLQELIRQLIALFNLQFGGSL